MKSNVTYVAVESRITENARRRMENPPQFPVRCSRTKRTNERMSPTARAQNPYLIHPQCRTNAAPDPTLTAMVSIFARQIWLFDSGVRAGTQLLHPRRTGRERACVFGCLLHIRPIRSGAPDFHSHGIQLSHQVSRGVGSVKQRISGIPKDRAGARWISTHMKRVTRYNPWLLCTLLTGAELREPLPCLDW